MSYVNQSKFERANAVVNNLRGFAEDSVEKKALSLCSKEKDQVKCVYVKLGGAFVEDVKKTQKSAEELPAGVVSSKKEGKEVVELPKPKK